MIAQIPLQLSAEDKLDALRYLDRFHFWRSLDDGRRCRCCGRSITGRQIAVFELYGTRGRLQLQCPSPGCLSTPSDWADLAPSVGNTMDNATATRFQEVALNEP